MSESGHHRHHGPEDIRVPWFALAGAALLIAITVILATMARLTDTGATRLTLAPVVKSRALNFSDLADGSVAVFDAKDKTPVMVLPAGHDGFVRTVLRGLAQDRAALGHKDQEPFYLSKLADGSSVLEDPTTGRIVTLNAFGAHNVAAFSQLIETTNETSSTSRGTPQ